MEPWKVKANMVIAGMCLASYRTANVRKDGRVRKKHVPYAVPVDARILVDCLGDPENGEVRAKGVFQRHAFGIVYE